MELEALTKILVDELGAKADGDVYTIPDGKRVTILTVSKPSDAIAPIPKVRSVRVTDDYVELVTEDTTYFVDRDVFIGVKLDEAGVRSDARPGFH